MSIDQATTVDTPGSGLNVNKMPGHWLLARLGKRVLRPGGLELTRQMIAGLNINATDRVVELAPGLGVTAALTLAKKPASYTGVERDETAATHIEKILRGAQDRCIVGDAEATTLPSRSATVVYGEAMLSMQTSHAKERIASEAARILVPGGRYGIHELCLQPDDVPETVKRTIESELTKAIHVGARPLTTQEWFTLLEGAGFKIVSVCHAPFRLLEPARLVRDEGLFGALRFASRVLRFHDARKRVLAMRRCFRQNARHLSGIAIIAEKA